MEDDDVENFLYQQLGCINDNCVYTDVSTVNIPNEWANDTFYTVLHLNVRSLPGKIDRVYDLISTLHSKDIIVDFILICETFMNNFNEKLCTLPGYNLVNNNRINGRGGGVCIYVRNGITYNVIESLKLNEDNTIKLHGEKS